MDFFGKDYETYIKEVFSFAVESFKAYDRFGFIIC